MSSTKKFGKVTFPSQHVCLKTENNNIYVDGMKVEILIAKVVFYLEIKFQQNKILYKFTNAENLEGDFGLNPMEQIKRLVANCRTNYFESIFEGVPLQHLIYATLSTDTINKVMSGKDYLEKQGKPDKKPKKKEIEAVETIFPEIRLHKTCFEQFNQKPCSRKLKLKCEQKFFERFSKTKSDSAKIDEFFKVLFSKPPLKDLQNVCFKCNLTLYTAPAGDCDMCNLVQKPSTKTTKMIIYAPKMTVYVAMETPMFVLVTPVTKHPLMLFTLYTNKKV